MSLTPAFQLRFGQAVLPNAVAVGRFDGQHYALACGTTGGRLFLHAPHDRDANDRRGRAANSIRFLNVNREVTTLGCGKLSPDHDRDILLIGTQNSLQAYDVMENRDLFYKEVPDAVTALVVGSWSATSGSPIAFAGGNCSVQGFDATGKDVYWTVTGDVVTSLVMGDIDNDRQTELLVGSADFDIRIYRGETIAWEAAETDRVTALAQICPGYWCYALANGTVGVYNALTNSRLWRIKTKSKAVALCTFDIDSDGRPEIIAAWANGKIEARRHTNGELVYRDSMPAVIAGMVVADYRGDNKPLLMIVTVEGEIRGYAASDAETLTVLMNAGSANSVDAARASPQAGPRPISISREASASSVAAAAGKPAEDASVAALLDERAKLEAELRALESAASAGKPTPLTTADVTVSREFSASPRRMELVVTVTNEALLRAVVVYSLDAGIFGPNRESTVVVPPIQSASTLAGTGMLFQETSTLRIPLNPAANVPTELRVQALVGARKSSMCFTVIEKVLKLPRFAMFHLIDTARTGQPRGSVSFMLKLRASQVAAWVCSAFQLRTEQLKQFMDSTPQPDGVPIEAYFVNARTGGTVKIAIAAEYGGRAMIGCDDMELCGEMVQDMAAYLAIGDLETLADFPADTEKLRQLLQQLDEYNSIRNKLTGEMAEIATQVKMLVIQAEDARLLADMATMKKYYTELRSVNGQLLGEYMKRASNHAALVATLKEVNQMIQRGANLRVGDPKAKVIAGCRAAIKSGKSHEMLSIIVSGK